MKRKSINGKYKLISLECLLPHEEIDESNLKKLIQFILEENKFTTPIIVDKKTNLIIDGHHRFFAAKSLKLQKIPVFQINYLQKEITVKEKSSEGKILSKKLIIKFSKAQTLLPKKSTFHEINIQGKSLKLASIVKKTNISLKQLK
tara:strand:- start:105 stop:542 length:438 start_codon:yes stop_codon:yes gene_type:complete